MIGASALVRVRVRARPVSNGRLARGGFMELSYDSRSPYEVKLSETGPEAGEVVFARELLRQALGGQPAGEGTWSAPGCSSSTARRMRCSRSPSPAPTARLSSGCATQRLPGSCATPLPSSRSARNGGMSTFPTPSRRS